MVAKAPLNRPHYIPEAKETSAETQARYEQIAADIVEVIKTEKPLFKGVDGKIRTSSVILSVMFHESGFRRDVDLGLGKLARGDHGNSVCLMQLNIGKGHTAKWNRVQGRFALPSDSESDLEAGLSAGDILANRQRCIRHGLRLIRLSFASCGRMPQKDWLRVYTSGSCSGGEKESASRMGVALGWYQAHKPLFDDSSLTAPASPPSSPTENPDQRLGYKEK